MNFIKKLFRPFKEGWDGPLPTVAEEQDIEIIDIIDDLPKHPTRKWTKRKTSQIDSIIVHQAISEGTFKGVANYHVTPAEDNHISKEGAPGICYTFGVDFDGTVCQLNKLTDVVWHASNHNTKSIGILLRGNFVGPEYLPPNSVKHPNPTSEQLASLEKLLILLIRDYNITKDKVYGHCDLAPIRKVNCPGKVAMVFLNNFKEK